MKVLKRVSKTACNLFGEFDKRYQANMKGAESGCARRQDRHATAHRADWCREPPQSAPHAAQPAALTSLGSPPSTTTELNLLHTPKTLCKTITKLRIKKTQWCTVGNDCEDILFKINWNMVIQPSYKHLKKYPYWLRRSQLHKQGWETRKIKFKKGTSFYKWLDKIDNDTIWSAKLK